MSSAILSSENETEIHRLFRNMILSPALDSDSLALSWLEKHEKSFCGFIDGCWLNKDDVKKKVKSELDCHKVCDVFTEKHLCDVYTSVDNSLLEYTAKNSASGFNTWSSLSPTCRSKILYNVAQTIEKYQQLFAIVEAVSTGKRLYKAKKDVSDFIENFYYYAGCALKLVDASVSKAWLPEGPVCVFAEEYNSPSLTLSLRVSALLAAGNSVLLLTDVKSCLSSFLLAEMCYESGIAASVLNVLPVHKGQFKTLENFSIFTKLVFTGTFERSVLFSNLCAQAKLSCDFLIPRQPVVIVYENADLHSAAKGVLEAIFYHDIKSKSFGCKVMIQESIKGKFQAILSNSTKACGNVQPIIQTNISNLVHEEVGGPVIVTIPFRTVKESISMFNCDNKGSPVSIWTEKISVALEAALKLKSGVIWVNSQNVFDAGAAFTGVYYSGNSVEGGQDAFFSHMSILPETGRTNKMNDPVQSFDHIVSLSSKLKKSSPTIQAVNGNKNEYKMYIGGVQKCSGNTVMLSENTVISSGSDSDLLSAVSSALAVQPKWEAFTDLQKKRFFIDIVEKLRKNREEYIAELQIVSENSLDVCTKEIDETLAILCYWISKNEKYSGLSQEIKKNLMVSQNRTPLGVIAIQCPDEKPLLSFISLVLPAIMYGNAVVAIASTRYPTLALKMCEIFTSANIPGGVINVIWGNPTRLISTLLKHSDVNAVWHTNLPHVIYNHCNVTQRLFCCDEMWNDVNEAKCLKYAMESTYIKSIFLPAGDIYAN